MCLLVHMVVILQKLLFNFKMFMFSKMHLFASPLGIKDAGGDTVENITLT